MADEHKGIANLHYPGIKADPNEGHATIDPIAKWRFKEQITCLGEPAQEKLAESSAFIIGASPLGVAAARKLLRAGIGRVGVYGDEAPLGAHGLSVPTEDGATALSLLAAWAARETPWAQLERFRASGIDRSPDDMARGFQLVIAAGGPEQAGQAVRLARPLGHAALAAQVSGRQAWCAAVPAETAGTVCDECLRVPALDAPASAGLYYPLIDYVSGWISTVAVELALGTPPAAAFVESIDATRVPWARETAPVQRCGKCAQAK